MWFALALLAAVAAALAGQLVPSEWPLGARLASAIGAAIAGATAGAFVSEWLLRRREKRAAAELLRRSRAIPNVSPAGLLVPSQRIVEFVGRDRELTDLLAWCEHETTSRVRLITGPGGVGKTRLAVELCIRLRELGWHCEQIAHDADSTALETVREVTSGRVLLVVDYAETRAGLAHLLRSVALGDDLVRVLLLARSAGEWWERLRTADAGVRKLLAADAGSDLSAQLDSERTDNDFVLSAVPQFAEKLQVQPPSRVKIVGGGSHHRRILDLHAAALVAVLRGTDDVQVDVGQVIAELLTHEKTFWRGTADRAGLTSGPAGMTLDVLGQIVAAASLLGADSEAECLAILERVPGAVPSRKVAHWLRGLYPPPPDTGEWLGSLQPDRLAELHTVTQLRNSQELAAACLTSLDDRQALRAITLLGRASTDPGIDARPLLTRIVPFVERIVAELPGDPDLLEAISAAIPHPSDVLAEAAVAIARRALDTVPPLAPAQRARWLTDLGQAQEHVGRPQEGVYATRDAVEIYRALTDADPDNYRPHLAGTLINLGASISTLGHPADALPHLREAIEILRSLATSDSEVSKANLAGALTNLARAYAQLGQPVNALLPTQEAAEITLELAQANRNRWLPRLADALTNLGSAHSELKQPEAALGPTETAIGFYQELANADPDGYRPYLAGALSNLGVRFSELNRPVEALPHSEAAVDTYRMLAAKYPARYRSYLALSMTNFSDHLVAADRAPNALPPANEAVGIYRELAEAQPERYRARLAWALRQVGVVFAALKRFDDAVPPTAESAQIYREMAENDPDLYTPELWKTMSNLLQMELALVEVNRGLADSNPELYRPQLAQSLTNLGGTLWALDRPQEAAANTNEAKGICEQLAASDPDQFQPMLAATVMNLGLQLADVSPANALPRCKEAVQMYRALAATYPSRYTTHLAISLVNLGHTLTALGRPNDALLHQEEAAEIHRRLTDVDSDASENGS